MIFPAKLFRRLTGIAFDLITDTPLFTDVTGVPLIEHSLFGKVFEKAKKASNTNDLRWDGSQQANKETSQNRQKATSAYRNLRENVG